MKHVYPEHLYEPIRREIGVSYIKRQLKIFLPSVKGKEQWADIGTDIESWFSEAPYLYPVRDFWNGLHGIMMGFKLLDHLLSFITAENIIWTKEAINIDDLYIPFPGEPKMINDPNDPIIVTQKKIDGKDELAVYDGNNRVNKAKADGIKTLSAYVSRFKGDSRKPENYWVPTSLLMEVNHFAKKAFEREDESGYKSYIVIFSDMLKGSESAKYEMRNRVIPKEGDYKNKLLSDLGLV